MSDYVNTADRLVERIEALVPAHPEILALDGPWGLFKIPGFNCQDLAPTMFQAGWALAQVQQRHGAAREIRHD